LNLVEMSRNREYSRCCGAGGGLKAGFPEIQGRMSQRRIKEAEETGAKDLVSCCPFCYQGLQVGINASGSDIVMRDLSEFIAESILGYDVFERAAKEAEEKKRLKEEAKAIKLLEKEKKAAEKKKAAEEKKKAAEEKKKAEEEKKAEQEKIEKKKPEAEDKIKEDKEVELPGEPDKAQ